MKKIESEKRTVEYMIALYCRKNHGGEKLCEDCDRMRLYAFDRLGKCQFGEEKPACKLCEVHCYKPEMRQKIREIMRYSGPRMVIYYPIDFVRHILKFI
ncbi:MAG: nitrous oxide-stimulated promoter family protein [Paludibacter sp.]